MPQTGYPHGRPGHGIDHVVPIAYGGAGFSIKYAVANDCRCEGKEPVERRACR